jgi:Arc/MetJ family transcription regulator
MLSVSIKEEGDSMRTTIQIDDEVFTDLMRITRASTKTEAVRIALNEYIRMRRKQQLLSLRGSLDLSDNWRELRDLEIGESSND